jgi:Spy/CpxP family protein refolding chaperone
MMFEKIMKKIACLSVVFVFVLCAGSVLAPDVPRPVGPPPDARHNGDQARPNLLRELNLSPDQLIAIRKINQDKRAQMEEAGHRLREANRMLDESIYSDAADESDFRVRLAEFQAAQAEVTRLRFANELAIRRILTAEQIAKFKELRQKFADERRKDAPRDVDDRRTLRRMRRGGGQPQPF